MPLNRLHFFFIKTTVMRTIIPTSSPSEHTPLTFLYHLSTQIMKTSTESLTNLNYFQPSKAAIVKALDRTTFLTSLLKIFHKLG